MADTPNMEKVRLRLVPTPRALPSKQRLGRVALVDLAFAFEEDYQRVTIPFIKARDADNSLAIWIDHHQHEAWPSYQHDPRFVLFPREEAPACPELVTPERVAAAGPIDRLLAHADFDGCVAAAKYLRGGVSPYPAADADARAVDTPGKGFVCSPEGERIASAFEEARTTLGLSKFLRLAETQVWCWVRGEIDPMLAEDIDDLAKAAAVRLDRLSRLADSAQEIVPGLLVCRVHHPLSGSERKLLLRILEERSRVALLAEDGSAKISLGTFDESLDLRGLPGVVGWAGFCWGEADLQTAIAHVQRCLAS